MIFRTHVALRALAVRGRPTVDVLSREIPVVARERSTTLINLQVWPATLGKIVFARGSDDSEHGNNHF